jgi:PAS domain S-box-containing protein
MLFLLMIMFPWSCAHAQERPRRILMLHAFNYTFPSTTIGGDAARKRLLERSPNKIEIGGEFLDLARFPGPDHEKRLVSFLREKYAASPPDVVMALGNLALQFIVKHRDSIAPAVPVVFAGIPPTAYSASRLPADVTGIITEFNLDKTLALAEALQPDARQVVMIGGSGLVDRQWQADARRTVESRGRKFETTYLFGLPYETLVAELARVPSNAIVIILTVFADSTGKSFVPAEVGAALAPLSPAPVYSPLSTFLGNGTVGGFIETFESVGVAAADLSLEIIAGKAPATIPPRANPGQAYRVDFRAMQRWNLREGDLPANTIVLFKDPTLWDRAEVLLKESEERMTFTAASVNLGLWQFDRETNELWATGHSRALFGLGDDVPLTNEAFLTAIHPEDRETAIASLSKATTSEGQSAVTDVRVAREGEQRWIRIRARSQPDDKGAPTQLSGIFVDITEQKIAEIESALQRQEVAHLMRVSVLGELSGAIAHEINQPLTAIQSNAETGLDLLAVDPPDLSEIREVFQDIVDDNRRASEVIQRLRNLLKKGETTPVSVDVNGLVTSTLALLNNELISRRISVKLDLASGLPATIGDPVQLQQVLLNLVMNAMDAMASTQIAQRLITVSTFNTRAGVIEAWVKDSGPGIQPAEESRVFEPFYTTKPSGLGLGLAICSTIIEAHGGDIELSNDNSGGAVAKISLPVRSMPIAAK